ncbi:acid protease [Exidia glandulosa HHB12029]|uniref:Acid protease n=1 Tax=Exidia glandulosa HHB12029 TaxID=1314781 RepID=A0A165L292_EXIGL|nr:acid protease [Exidia glandulosa HHB12029]
MRSLEVLLATVWLTSSVSAVRLPFHQLQKRTAKRGAVSFHAARSASTAPTKAPPGTWQTLAATGATDIDLRTSRDLIYIADVTVSGTDYAVQLDTGSSDLWVHTTSGVRSVHTTGLQYNLTYGIGYAYGNIVTADVEFAGFELPRQALIDAVDASNPVLNLGAVGVLGLGFTGLSAIDSTVNGTGDSYGRSLLYNVFAQDASVPNFITFLLSRSNDPNAPVEGSFTISETDDDYTAVTNGVKVPTFPVEDPIRWCVLLDGFAADGKRFAVGTTVKKVASGKAVILLDSGTTFTYAPDTVVDAIYSELKGANFDYDLGQWVVPCDTEVQVSLYIGGQQYDLHPLDMVVPSTSDSKTCVGSFIPMSLPIAEGEFDWLIGVNVLRSFYSLYDFGDPVGKSQGIRPFVQLLQLRTALQASQDFHIVRGGEVPAAPANAAPADGGSTATPSQSGNGTSTDSGSDSTDSSFTNISASVKESIGKLVDYMPAMLGVLGVNVAILLALFAAAVLWVVRRRKSKKRPSPLTLAGAEGGSLYKAVSTHDQDGRTTPMRQRTRSPLPASPLTGGPNSAAPLVQAPAPQYDSSSMPLRRPVMPAAAFDADRHSTAF